MRYLGVALGQSISLGTCAGLGTIMGPILLHLFFPEQNALERLTFAVIIGVIVTLLGIAIIGIAGGMKSASLVEKDQKDLSALVGKPIHPKNKETNEVDTTKTQGTLQIIYKKRTLS